MAPIEREERGFVAPNNRSQELLVAVSHTVRQRVVNRYSVQDWKKFQILFSQRHKRRAPPTHFRRRIAKTCHERRFGQYRPDYFSLHADAAAMDNTQSFETRPLCFF